MAKPYCFPSYGNTLLVGSTPFRKWGLVEDSCVLGINPYRGFRIPGSSLHLLLVWWDEHIDPTKAACHCHPALAPEAQSNEFASSWSWPSNFWAEITLYSSFLLSGYFIMVTQHFDAFSSKSILLIEMKKNLFFAADTVWYNKVYTKFLQVQYRLESFKQFSLWISF